ncbi:SDR family oxidoreductase [Pseudohalocynthiibacter sp. F2068]|jgi:uncharacterized protein YbjT (DUF2867 family)|uniref:SDR family oxidoreductase n=1 Tax=Pseudohalocynthiibacter sp. F2068 TaxID=2926418 RepID=UPI001FF0FB62|nr:SDR family oxidoreductase [Pseudohalocynthiibacter sp. F2068]MCK0101454.1 SDR family oxidoreductase [Pseudohalocynthiibacter sp. F2068]
MEKQNPKTAIVLGAYGLIGSACLSALKQEGYRVIGVGRSRSAGLRCDPKIGWLERDISKVPVDTWKDDLKGADIVVNASGALQSGAKDSLSGIHETAVARLVSALEGTATLLIQISAAGVSDSATTEFFRSKMRGDRMIMQSNLAWIILRPTLVLSIQAYGGTALLRASAAFPMIGVSVFPDAPFQTVFVEDVAQAVVQAAKGEIPTGTVADLTEEETCSFQTVNKMVRGWLGFKPWMFTLSVPAPLLRLTGLCADALGWLGWRPPLRSTALKVLADGIKGDTKIWANAGGLKCRSLVETLDAIPATTQERWFARLYLLLPIAIATLSVFWIISGLVGLAENQKAQVLLTDRGLSPVFATLSVFGGSIVDIMLGLAVLVRPWARKACYGMVVVSIAYFAAGTLLTPDIWGDPLGPFVKVLPGIMLASFVASILEDR